jgi:hypothetical protein
MEPIWVRTQYLWVRQHFGEVEVVALGVEVAEEGLQGECGEVLGVAHQ